MFLFLAAACAFASTALADDMNQLGIQAQLDLMRQMIETQSLRIDELEQQAEARRLEDDQRREDEHARRLNKKPAAKKPASMKASDFDSMKGLRVISDNAVVTLGAWHWCFQHTFSVTVSAITRTNLLPSPLHTHRHAVIRANESCLQKLPNCNIIVETMRSPQRKRKVVHSLSIRTTQARTRTWPSCAPGPRRLPSLATSVSLARSTPATCRPQA